MTSIQVQGDGRRTVLLHFIALYNKREFQNRIKTRLVRM